MQLVINVWIQQLLPTITRLECTTWQQCTGEEELVGWYEFVFAATYAIYYFYNLLQ